MKDIGGTGEGVPNSMPEDFNTTKNEEQPEDEGPVIEEID